MTTFSPQIKEHSKSNTLNTQAENAVWTEPKPIQAIKQPLSPVLPMTPEMIPLPYQGWLMDVAERMQCPLDYVAVGAIIVTGSLIGAGCGICPKRRDPWTVIPNLWGGIVGSPGVLKSPALKEVMRPLKALELKSWKAYAETQEAYTDDIELHKATKESLKKEIGKVARDSNSALDALKQEFKELKTPKEPSCRRYGNSLNI